MHGGTRFAVFVKDIRKADIVPLGHFLAAAIETELSAENLPAEVLGSLDASDAVIAKTASRSVLGTMNEIALHISYAVAHRGGISAISAGEINHQLQRTLHQHGKGYATALDLIGEGRSSSLRSV